MITFPTSIWSGTSLGSLVPQQLLLSATSLFLRADVFFTWSCLTVSETGIITFSTRSGSSLSSLVLFCSLSESPKYEMFLFLLVAYNYPELSDLFFFLPVGCTASLSMGAFLLRVVSVSRSYPFRKSVGWEWLSTGFPNLKWFEETFVFLFTLNLLRLTSMVHVEHCLGSLQDQKRTSGFPPKRKYGLLPNIYRENGDRYCSRTQHNDLSSPLQCYSCKSRKTLRKITSKRAR